MKSVNFGILGCGFIGRIHLKSLMNIESAGITAVCDLNPSVLQRFGELSGLSKDKLHMDYRRLLEDSSIDAVIVGLPNRLHASVTIEALEEGKHVFCEKPMATNFHEAKAMIDAATKTGNKLFVGLASRFGVGNQILKMHVDNGELGEVYYAKCSATRRSGIPGWGSWFTRKIDAGAGPIYDIGVHILDLAFWLISNFRPASVYASKYAKFGPNKFGLGSWGTPELNGYFDVEDLATAMIKMENDASVFFEASWASHIPKEVFNVMLVGEKAGLDIDLSTIFSTEMGSQVDKKIRFEDKDRYLAEMNHFINCILKDEEPLTKPEEMLGLQKTLDMILKSSTENRVVTASEIQ